MLYTHPIPAPRAVIKAITGQFLARATVNYPAHHRARDAARWLRGELTIKPTVKLAAETFGVSVPLVAEARDDLARDEQRKRFGGNGNSITTLSDDAIERIVREVGVDRIWCAVEKLTQPQLPLVAAE
jgi:hypothetical protein